MHKNPYGDDLGNRDPLQALAETSEKIRALVSRWTPAQWNQSYAPGKWTGRQVIVHLAQTELALTTRARYGAAEKDYKAQPFSQDDWIALDDKADGQTALEAYLALRRLNVLMFRHMPPAQRTRGFHHSEYGEITAEWIAAQLAGHDLHHLSQLQQIT